MKTRRKINQFFAMLLAVSLTLTGCVADFPFYADEDTGSVSGNDPVIESVSGSDLSVSGSDALSPIEVDGDYGSGFTDCSTYVRVSEGGSITLSGSENTISISRITGSSATVSMNSTTEEVDLTHDGLFRLRYFPEGSEITVTLESPEGYKVEQYVALTDTGDVVCDISNVSCPYANSIVSSDNLSISADFREVQHFDLFVGVSNYGMATFVTGEQYNIVANTEEGAALYDIEGNSSDIVYSPEGYIYLGSYLEGTQFSVGLQAEDIYEISYEVNDSEGNLSYAQAFTAYGETVLDLTQDTYVSINFDSQDLAWLEEIINMDWRASTSERLLYEFDGADDPETGKGQVYWGETIEELIAMVNDDSFNMTDDWDKFFENTVFEGTDYSGLLYLAKNGYSFNELVDGCCEKLVGNIWPLITGVQTYAGNLGKKGIVKYYSNYNTTAILPEIFGASRHQVLALKIYTSAQSSGVDAFCIDPAKPMSTGVTVMLADESDGSTPFKSVSQGHMSLGTQISIFKAIWAYTTRINGSPVYNYNHSRLFLWTSGDQHAQEKFLKSLADYEVTHGSEPWTYSALMGSKSRQNTLEINRVYSSPMVEGTGLSFKLDNWGKAYVRAYTSFCKLEHSMYKGNVYIWTKEGTLTSGNQRLVTWKIPNQDTTTTKPTATPSVKDTGKVEVQKVDGYGAGLGGAEFAILNSSINVVGVITTDGTGYGKLEGLVPGVYYIAEMTPPPNHIGNSAVVQFSISASNNFTYFHAAENLKENPPCYITIKKEDDSGNYLPGCGFRIWGNGIDITYNDIPSEGVTVGPLVPGAYKLFETKWVDSHDKDNQIHTVYVDAGTNYHTEFTFVNKSKGNLVILNKYDKGTTVHVSSGVPYNNSKGLFAIYNRDTSVLIKKLHLWNATSAFDDSNHIYLQPGNYVIREQDPPYGYTRMEDVYFSVPESGTTTVNFEDDYTKIKVRKVDEKTGVGLKDAIIYLMNIIPGESPTIYASFKTDSNGYGVVTGIYGVDGEIGTTGGTIGDTVLTKVPAGRYILHEEQAPDGYMLAEDQFIEITETASVQSFVMKDTSVKISIQKTDDKDAPLIDAHLELYKAENVSSPSPGEYTYIVGSFMDKWVSTTASHVIEGVELDQWYVLRETSAPSGFESFGERLIQLGHQHMQNCRHIHTSSCKKDAIRNSRQWNIGTSCGCDKHGHEWTCNICGRVVDDGWTQKNNGGCIMGHVNNSRGIVADSSGTNHCSHWDTQYYTCGFPEDSDGSYLCGQPEFVLDSEGMYVVKVPNTPSNTDEVKIKVSVSKEDVTTHTGIAGAEFELWNSSKSQLFDRWTSGSDGYTDGVLNPHYIYDLPVGDYVVVETKSPKGYIKSNDVYFSVAYTNNVQGVTIYNQPSKVEITKVFESIDTESTKNLTAKLELREMDKVTVVKDLDGNPCRWDAAANLPTTLKGVPVGTYCIVETETPTGYITAEPVLITVIDTTDVQRFTMVNRPIVALFGKRDKVSNALVGKAHLQLWTNVAGNKGTLMYDWWSTDGEYQEIKAIPAGDYILTEVQAPNGLVKIEQAVTITKQSEPQVIEAYDPRINVSINKTDVHTSYTLPGSTLRLWKASAGGASKLGVFAEWVSESTPYILGDDELIPAGWYILEEINPTTGYTIADPIAFEVKEQEAVQSFTLTNDYQFLGFELTKVDGITGEVIGDKADDYSDKSIAQFELQEYNNKTNQWEISKDYKIVYKGKGYYSVATTLVWGNGEHAKDGFLYWSPNNNGMFRYREVVAPYGYEVDGEWVYGCRHTVDSVLSSLILLAFRVIIKSDSRQQLDKKTGTLISSGFLFFTSAIFHSAS